MKKSIFNSAFYILVALTTVVRAEPFQTLSGTAEKQWGGWHGSQQVLSKLFAEERKKLGDDFQSELMAFLGDDPEKHYRIAGYLVHEEYLHGAKPLPMLALLLQEQGIVLCRTGRGKRSEQRLVALLVTSAVIASQERFSYLASARKHEAEQLIEQNPDLKVAWPALSDEERTTYKNIGTAGSPMKSVGTKAEP